jgi:hypothetical protein
VAGRHAADATGRGPVNGVRPDGGMADATRPAGAPRHSTAGAADDTTADATTLGLTSPMNALQTGGPVDSPVQRARQSGARRYE